MKSIKLHCLCLAILIMAGCNTDPDIQVPSVSNVSVYPNPAIDYVNIDVRFPGTSSLEVFDSEGESVLKTTLNGEGSVPLHLNNSPSGIYHVIVRNGAQTVTKEFIRL